MRGISNPVFGNQNCNAPGWMFTHSPHPPTPHHTHYKLFVATHQSTRGHAPLG